MSHFLKDLASLFAITAFCVVVAVVLGAIG